MIAPFISSIQESLKLLRKALVSDDKTEVQRALAYADTTMLSVRVYTKRGRVNGGGNPNHDRAGRFANAPTATFSAELKKWVDRDGKPVSAADQRILKRVPESAIWAKVNPDKNDLHIAQYKSHPKPGSNVSPFDNTKGVQWVADVKKKGKRVAAKWKRLKKFDSAKRKIDAKAFTQAMKWNQNAAVALIMDRTAFRIGSDDSESQVKDDEGAYTGNSKKTYGASTLLGKHVKVSGNKTRFQFTAKDGVEVDKTINDPKLAQVMTKYLARTKPNERIFEDATAESVKRWTRKVSGMTINNHDYRYWHATALAWKMLLERGIPKGPKELKAVRNEIGDAVAAILVNTRAKALGFYINPCVWVTAMNPFKSLKAVDIMEDGENYAMLCKSMESLFNSIDFDVDDISDDDPWEGFDEDSDEPDWTFDSDQKKNQLILDWKAAWEEAQHPRDRGGRFAEKDEAGFSEFLLGLAKQGSDLPYKYAQAAAGDSFYMGYFVREVNEADDPTESDVRTFEWFNPLTGEAAPLDIYDFEPYTTGEGFVAEKQQNGWSVRDSAGDILLDGIDAPDESAVISLAVTQLNSSYRGRWISRSGAGSFKEDYGHGIDSEKITEQHKDTITRKVREIIDNYDKTYLAAKVKELEPAKPILRTLYNFKFSKLKINSVSADTVDFRATVEDGEAALVTDGTYDSKKGDLHIGLMTYSGGSENQTFGSPQSPKLIEKLIDSAKIAGVKKITTTSARSGNFTGYKTWPALGFDIDWSDSKFEYMKATVEGRQIAVNELVAQLTKGDMSAGKEAIVALRNSITENMNESARYYVDNYKEEMRADVEEMIALGGPIFSLINLVSDGKGRKMWSKYGVPLPLVFSLEDGSNNIKRFKEVMSKISRRMKAVSEYEPGSLEDLWESDVELTPVDIISAQKKTP